ncbi:glycoside hydrolase family 32 protein [Tunicatimonas pelagia]|uniref:glycoside hydrolase family 32 protein n=1 Tax=Tunicatimonas pelagia TaxID=931531 RepID=UPI00266555DC|nr:glycoside hydrolase family 32 protein [Tunicatimonas pelagia]WKN41255.1 glycoside hydrolase family 32 protein [Tunicatimonas pelagia]
MNTLLHIATVRLLALVIGCQPTTPETAKAVKADSTDSGEQYRLVYHFTPPQQWMNDPNGMVFYDGEYHLFYQHYPDSNVWGPMHWGHAVSEDLVHWEHLPIALYPDSLGYIFSGSAIVDHNNTSSLGTDGNPPLIAIFTYHDPADENEDNYLQTQGLAYSNDRGRTWAKYEGNPVIENPGIKDFRDPKVFWYEADQNRAAGRWVMVLAVDDRIHLYESPNLTEWSYLSEFGENSGSHGGVWECPDLFRLTADSGEQKWVLLLSINPGGPNGGSATQYFVGDFDGTTFTNDNPDDMSLWLDYGKDNYAGVTWSDIPESDERRIFLGWMSNWQYGQEVPTYTWRSAMTVPRTLHLVKTEAGLRVASQPVDELYVLRKDSIALEATTLQGNRSISSQLTQPSPTLELKVEFDISEATAREIGVKLSNSLGEEVIIGYNLVDQEYFVDRTNAGETDFSEDFSGRFTADRVGEGDILSMHLFIDVASVELFGDDGTTIMSNIFFPNEEFTQVALFAKGGKVQIIGGEIYNLKAKV